MPARPDSRKERVKIPANQLSAHLKSTLLPCYLVSGDEPLLVQESTDAIRQKARSTGMDTRELHVADTRFDWNELQGSAGNMSLFAERRIIELRLPTGKPGRQGGEAIVELTAQSGPELLLIVSTPKLDKSVSSSAWVKALDKKGGAVQVWPVGIAELPRWINERMRRAGLVPDRDAVQLLVDRVEGNLLAAQQEIDKLSLCIGSGKISAADIENSVADSSRFDVYKLVDAALAGDAARGWMPLQVVNWLGLRSVWADMYGKIEGEYTPNIPYLEWRYGKPKLSFSQLADLIESEPDGLFASQDSEARTN
jgi:DNA polymerase-3 subunit delta